jgi:hypothetical protein
MTPKHYTYKTIQTINRVALRKTNRSLAVRRGFRRGGEIPARGVG